MLPPPIVCPLGTHRWLEAFQKGPWAKKDRRRVRLTFLDGVLSLLRSQRDGIFSGLVAQGEGALVASTLVSPEIRSAAYKERHVSPEEVAQLEEHVKAINVLLLLAPQGHPPNFYYNFLKEAVPEIASMVVDGDTCMIVIVPLQDAATQFGRSFSRTIAGAETYEKAFKGPSYCSLPEDLDVNLTREKLSDSAVSGTLGPKVFYELFAGSATLSKHAVRFGFVAKAYEKYPVVGEVLAEGDLGLKENLIQLEDDIRNHRVFEVHLSPDCSSFSPLQNLNKNSTWTPEKPQGTGENEDEVAGNEGLVIAFWIIFLCLCYGVFFTFEHPTKSKAWKFPLMLWLLSLACMFSVEYEGCAWGLRPAGWRPEDGDVRVQKSSRLITTNPLHEQLRRRCGDVDSHSHEALMGSNQFGHARSRIAAAYEDNRCIAYVQGMLRAWRNRWTPGKPNDLKHVLAQGVEVETFKTKDFGWTPDLPVPKLEARNRPVEEEGDSEASGSGEKKDEVKYFWVQTEKLWVRHHVAPRRRLFDPTAETLLPFDLESITTSRITAVYVGAHKPEARQDAWTKKSDAATDLGYMWTGRTVFSKTTVGTVASSSSDASLASGKELGPFKVTLSEFREEMALAQRRDVGLIEIIALLQKKKFGEVLARPRRDAGRVKARAADCRLENDGLLTELVNGLWLPIVPNVTFTVKKVENAPPNFTWKHFLLGSCHNISTAVHRNAKDMQAELATLVQWTPPREFKERL